MMKKEQNIKQCMKIEKNKSNFFFQIKINILVYLLLMMVDIGISMMLNLTTKHIVILPTVCTVTWTHHLLIHTHVQLPNSSNTVQLVEQKAASTISTANSPSEIFKYRTIKNSFLDLTNLFDFSFNHSTVRLTNSVQPITAHRFSRAVFGWV